MITATALALALALQVLTAAPASAVSFAECQAWLCLPGGFPPWECDAAHTAVLRRLAALKPALPSWSSCASAFGWDSANLAQTNSWHDPCPTGGSPNRPAPYATTCRGTGAGGCEFSYSAQQKVTVQVAVDGATSFAPNQTLTHTVSAASGHTVDQSTCPTPDKIPEDDCPLPPPMSCLIVGPPAPN